MSTGPARGPGTRVGPLLEVELMLYVARNPNVREILGEDVVAMRKLVGEIASTTLATTRPDLEVDPYRLRLVLVAIEGGPRLHRLIDP